MNQHNKCKWDLINTVYSQFIRVIGGNESLNVNSTKVINKIKLKVKLQ